MAIKINTPVENHPEFGLWVKREDLCAEPPWPPFSKTRGVYAHMVDRMASGYYTFGVLDTVHSQGGLAVAAAGAELGARVLNFYPVFKADVGKPVRRLQAEAEALGAELYGLPAGRSAVLYHQARRMTLSLPSAYMYPNALKLPETVEETAQEVARTLRLYPSLADYPWLVSASSGTIAAGVSLGLTRGMALGKLIIHMGYNRPEGAVRAYIEKMSRVPLDHATIIQEGYEYKDVARPGTTPPWPCNNHYDLKAFRWWQAQGRVRYGEAVLWNIG